MFAYESASPAEVKNIYYNIIIITVVVLLAVNIIQSYIIIIFEINYYYYHYCNKSAEMLCIGLRLRSVVRGHDYRT